MTRLLIVGTGGTMNGHGTSKYITTDYQSGTHSVKDLTEGFPSHYNIQFECIDLAEGDSTNRTTKDLIELCDFVHERLDQQEVHGAVLPHGTDTLKEALVGLHCTRRSHKPIILTAAVRPPSAIGTDSSRNFFTAVMVAMAPSASGREVMLVIDGKIWPCFFTTKSHLNSTSPFSAHGRGALGVVEDDKPHFYSDPVQPFQPRFDTRKMSKQVPTVAWLCVHPEFPTKLVKTAIDDNAIAIVFSGYGLGYWGIEKDDIKEMLDQSNMLAVMCHQGCEGYVERSEAGFGIPCGWLHPREVILILKFCHMAQLNRAEKEDMIFSLGLVDRMIRSRE
ncbi:hypothetical protein ACJZ2D_014354 [Fusarium nematophilum]